MTAVTCAHLDGHAVAVTGGSDGSVWIWDLTTGTPIGEPLMGHTGSVTAVACAQLRGRTIGVSGSWDHLVQVWDLASSALINVLPAHTGPVTAVACTQLYGHPIAVTSGRDHTVRMWDLRTRRPIDRIDLPSEVKAVTGTPAGAIVAAFGRDIVLLERLADA